MGQSAGSPAVAAPPVRVVCPFVGGGLNPDTAVALQLSGLDVIWAKLSRDDPGAYGRLFRDLWADGHTFVICEQDVIPTPDQLRDIATCGHGWCSFNYDTALYPEGAMFGLVRFDAQVMAEHPHAAAVSTITGKRRDQEAEWWRVDSLVARDLNIRGVLWNVHTPPVRHAHVGAPSGPP